MAPVPVIAPTGHAFIGALALVSIAAMLLLIARRRNQMAVSSSLTSTTDAQVLPLATSPEFDFATLHAFESTTLALLNAPLFSPEECTSIPLSKVTCLHAIYL